MMKKIIVAISLVVCSAATHASYLYWQVDSADAGSSTEWANGYDLATVWAVDASSDPTSKTKLGDGVNDYVSTFNGKTGLITVDVSNFKTGNYSFYIELASSTYSTGNKTTVATSGLMSYAELQTAGSIQSSATLSDIPSVAAWHGGSYKAAPEPTSAMLMLLGVAGLALRRKQRTLA